MLLVFNPTISGKFVHEVMRDPHVAEQITNNNIEEERVHDLVKSILIAGTRDLEVDFDGVLKKKLAKEREKIAS